MYVFVAQFSCMCSDWLCSEKIMNQGPCQIHIQIVQWMHNLQERYLAMFLTFGANN